METVIHSFEPVYDENSKVLLLGTIPSPKSRENTFYYGHPQNRFWSVLKNVFSYTGNLSSVEDKRQFLLSKNIALWDVLSACDIEGADDASIKNPLPNDLNYIIQKSKIKQVFTTGAKAHTLYEKLSYPSTQIHAVKLLSTSPANCRYKLEELVADYSRVREYV